MYSNNNYNNNDYSSNVVVLVLRMTGTEIRIINVVQLVLWHVNNFRLN
jgi:hypothetical protein